MRFYNSGKYLQQFGRNKETGEMVESWKELKPSGYDTGTAIVNFPGTQFKKIVKQGEWVDVPEDLFGFFNHQHDYEVKKQLADKQTIHAVKSHCPSLLTEEEAVPFLSAPAKKGKD